MTASRWCSKNRFCGLTKLEEDLWSQNASGFACGKSAARICRAMSQLVSLNALRTEHVGEQE